MIVAGQYTIPDQCPDDCPHLPELARFDMGCTCFRCPVLNCGGGTPALDPAEYNPVAAEGWAKFFHELEAKRGTTARDPK